MRGGVRPPGDARAAAALGYLHANCGNCHNSTGVATLRTRLLAANTTVESTDTYTTGVRVTPSFWEPGALYRITPGRSRVERRRAPDGEPRLQGPDAPDRVGRRRRGGPRGCPLLDRGPRAAARGRERRWQRGQRRRRRERWRQQHERELRQRHQRRAAPAPAAGLRRQQRGLRRQQRRRQRRRLRRQQRGSGASSGGSGAACAGVPRLKLTQVAAGLATPVFLASPPGDRSRMFVLEKDGIVRLIKDGVLRSTPFLDIRGGASCPPAQPASANPLVCAPSPTAEGGLLGMAFHPGYASNGRFWLFYTAAPRGNVKIAEFRRSASNPDVADTSAGSVPVRTLLDASHGGWNHAGGTLAFGPDGYLYASVGDSAVTPYSASPAKDLVSARQDPADRRGQRARPVRQPLGRGREPARLGLRPAQSMAHQLRPEHRGSLHRRRGTELLGRARHRARAHRAAQLQVAGDGGRPLRRRRVLPRRRRARRGA